VSAFLNPHRELLVRLPENHNVPEAVRFDLRNVAIRAIRAIDNFKILASVPIVQGLLLRLVRFAISGAKKKSRHFNPKKRRGGSKTQRSQLKQCWIPECCDYTLLDLRSDVNLMMKVEVRVCGVHPKRGRFVECRNARKFVKVHPIDRELGHIISKE
jgi:hypothetical protein